METQGIALERHEARKLWQKYQSHRHNRGPLDAEIQRVYHAISKGRVVIKAIESIIAAGLATAYTLSAWPDLIVGLGIAAMNADAARDVWTAARKEHGPAEAQSRA